MERPIDFVILWVDGGDPAWRAERAEYSSTDREDNDECRFRDWGLLRYWFRGVEKFAPWVRKIHFVTWGHLPAWLMTDHPKLHIVKHGEYIPEEYLPTFSSHVLENGLHQIEGLAEQFVYFNDDMFLIRPVKPEQFFRDGKPCDMLAFQPVVANSENPVMSHIYLNNSLALCRHFDKRKSVRQRPLHYFHPGYPLLYFFYNLLELAFPKYTGLYTVHGPSPLLKSTFREVWDKEPELLSTVLAHRFRSQDDVNQYLFREWQKLSGNFHPRNITRDFAYFNVSDDNQKLIRTIKNQKRRIVCLNDSYELKDVEHVRQELQGAFQAVLPEKSTFEC